VGRERPFSRLAFNREERFAILQDYKVNLTFIRVSKKTKFHFFSLGIFK